MEDREQQGPAEPAAEAAAPPSPRTVRGRVAGVVKGGFEVLVDDQRAFCSNGQIDLKRVDDPAAYLGQELEFQVLDKPDESGRILLSRRRILTEDERRRRQEIRSEVVPGAVLQGRVVRLASFGAFVDLGGFEGLVHVSEVSHEHVENLAERVFVGQQVQVRVLKTDEAKKRVSLSMKALEPDPWAAVAEKFPTWTVVEGRIARTTEFGAFLELAPGIEGLLHEEELPRGALPHLEEAAKNHRRMVVVVLDVDRRRRRIALAPAPAGVEPGQVVERVAFRRGGVVTGTVEQTTQDGVLVRFGPGQLGLIQPFESGTPRGSDLGAQFPRGSSVTAEVLSVEPGGRRAYLSRKRALRKEERAEVDRHMKSQEEMRFPTLGDLLRQAQSKPTR